MATVVLFTIFSVAVTVADVAIGAAVIGGAVLLGALATKKKSTTGATTPASLQQTLNPEEFRKFVFGETVVGNDLRYWEVYGTTGYDQVIAAATHKLTSFQTLYVEGAAVGFTGHNATGTYAGALSFYGVNQGVSGSSGFGVAVGAGALYSSTAASSTGCATYLLKWTYSQKTLPNGFPTRIALVGEGCPVYDPRKDSTNGGSGTHRPNDNTTWTYSDLDSNSKPIGRNNALQMLTYLLGWRIPNPSTGEKVLVFGRGVDPTDIDFANFIAAANTCETEGYYTDMVGSTGDSHTTNEGIISCGGIHMLLDNGGLWSYFPATNDTASIAVALGDDDVISGADWNPTTNIANKYNQIGGNFVDPTTPALYQPMPYPVVKDATYLAQDGGFPDRQTMDFQNVLDPALAQKLARIWLNRNRLTGQFKATFNYRILKAVNWNCITLSFSALGWTSKLFRIQSMAINPQGGVDAVLSEESTSAYTGGTVVTYTTPSAGTGYDVRQAIALAGLAAATASITGANGTASDALNISWTATSQLVRYVEVYIRKTGTTNYALAGQPVNGINNVLTAPLEPNTGYDIQARTISINDVPGAFSSITKTTGNTEVANLVVGQGTGATTNVGSLATLSSVATGNINSNAVTNPISAFTATTTAFTGAVQTVQTAGITTAGGITEISASFGVTGSSGAGPGETISFAIQRDGVTIYSDSVLNGSIAGAGFFLCGPLTIATKDSPSAASHTYTLLLQCTGTNPTAFSFYQAFLSILEIKR